MAPSLWCSVTLPGFTSGWTVATSVRLPHAAEDLLYGLAGWWPWAWAGLSIVSLLTALHLLRRWRNRVSRERQALKRTQEWFHFVLGNVKDYAIFTLDGSGRVTSWNAGAHGILGYQPSEILGANFSRFFPSEDVVRGLPESELREAARQGRFETEGWRVRKSGSHFWANAVLTALRDANGELRGFLKITRDISEQRRAEEELRQREELMNSFFAGSPIGLAILNLEFRFQKVNGTLCAMTGQTLRDCLGKSIQEVLGDLAPQVEGWLQEVAATGSPLLNRELWWPGLGAGRQPGYWVASYFPVLSENGELRQIGVLFVDITERQQTEEALREGEATLRRLSGQLLKTQDQERRRIARELHDSVGQSLAALEMNLKILAGSGWLQDARSRQALAESFALADQCLDEIRTISHLLHPPALELGLPSALRSYVEGFAERSGIQVRLDVPPDFARFPADAEIALFRIVQEGLRNIHQHSGSPTAGICLAQDAEYLVLELSDQGQGMPHERLHRCNGHTAAPGVGIAGMRERIRQLGGRLEVESSPRGTTVRALLPLDIPRPEVVHEIAAYIDCR